MLKLSHIVITNNYERYKNELIYELGSSNLRFFENDDFKVENAKEVIAEAYIAENSTKFIIIRAEKFGEEAQNTLLKILEEPPRNIVFIIVASSKNLLLATIRSRLLTINKFQKKEIAKIGINFKKLSLKESMEFINSKIALEKVGELDKFALKELVGEIIFECLEQGVKFSEKELEYLNKLIFLCEFNAKAHAVLTPLMLLIKEKNENF